MTNSRINKSITIILIITVMIDVMGMGLIFPILPSLFLSNNSPFLSMTASISMRHVFYAIGIAFWPIGAFFGAPYLGKISDTIGRKKVLILSLL